MRVRVRRLVPCVLFVVLAVRAVAQEAVPSARTEVVRVDVVVTDSAGRTVRDLKAEDFEVREDGKPQALTFFSFIASPPREAAAAAAPPAPVEPAASPAPTSAAPAPPASVPPAPAAPGRVVLLAVDDVHIAFGGLEHTRAALRRILSDFVAADDQVGLITTSGHASMSRFTRERGELMAAISALRLREASVAESRGSRMTPGHAELILGGDRGALELAGRWMLAEPGSLYDNMGPRAASEQQVAVGNSPAGLEDSKLGIAENDARRQARGLLLEALTFSTMSLRTVENAVRDLTDVPGRKICLLVSDGFLIGKGTAEERADDFRRVIDAATRSGTAVYTLDSRGLVTTGGTAHAPAKAEPGGLSFRVARQVEDLERTTLAEVAEQTGGFLLKNTNDFEAGLRRMLDDSGAYYLLAFEPANTKRDGRFRKIEVRLPAHRGLEVRTRRGYFAPDDRKKPEPPAPAAPPPTVTAADLHALLAAPLPGGGVPVRLGADYVDLPPVGGQAVVQARLDLGGLGWRKTKDRHELSLDLVTGLFDAAGAAVGTPTARRLDLSLTDGELKRAKQEGFFHRATLPLPPGRYEVRLLARGVDGTTLGGARESVEIPDLAAKKLTLSSVFLSSAGASGGRAAAGDEALRDMQMTRRFKRGETLLFQLYVYNPLVDDAGGSDVVLQAQLRAAEKVIAASRPQPVTFARKDGVPVPQTHSMPLEGLPAGAYELRVMVVDRKAGVNAWRDIAFTLD